MKLREPRLNVMIKARMRAGAAWSDALILNMSSRGMLVRSDRSPGRGSYLEIRRGPHIIVARVIWTDSGRFGVQTQDPVPTASLIRDPDAAVPTPADGDRREERRAAPRSTQVRHESSRHKARVAQFAAIATVCGLAAVLLAGAVTEIVAKPLGTVEEALASK